MRRYNAASGTNTYAYDMMGVHIANQNGTVISYLKNYHGSIVDKTTKSGVILNEIGNSIYLKE